MKFGLLICIAFAFLVFSVDGFLNAGGLIPLRTESPVLMADIETGVVHTVEETINWFSAIVSSIMAFIILAMIKHMWNSDRHLDEKKKEQIENHLLDKKHIMLEQFSPKDYVTLAECAKTHNEVLRRLDENGARFLRELNSLREDLSKQIQNSMQQNEKALTYTRKMIALLLKEAGVKDTSVLEKPE